MKRIKIYIHRLFILRHLTKVTVDAWFFKNNKNKIKKVQYRTKIIKE